jgi:hypothetical protein
MVASPSATPDDPWQRLTQLEKIVAALANKTLYSANIGAGGLTINGGSIDVNSSGIDKFHTGPDLTVIRDQAGDIVISDDIVAGWGFTQPNLSVPLYSQLSTAPFFVFNAGLAGVDILIYQAACPANNPRINWNYLASTSTSVATNCTFSLTAQSTGLGTVTLDSVNLTVSTSSSVNRAGSSVFPSNIFGQVVTYKLKLNYTNAGNAGTEFGLQPFGLYGSGA